MCIADQTEPIPPNPETIRLTPEKPLFELIGELAPADQGVYLYLIDTNGEGNLDFSLIGETTIDKETRFDERTRRSVQDVIAEQTTERLPDGMEEFIEKGVIVRCNTVGTKKGANKVTTLSLPYRDGSTFRIEERGSSAEAVTSYNFVLPSMPYLKIEGEKSSQVDKASCQAIFPLINKHGFSILFEGASAEALPFSEVFMNRKIPWSANQIALFFARPDLITAGELDLNTVLFQYIKDRKIPHLHFPLPQLNVNLEHVKPFYREGRSSTMTLGEEATIMVGRGLYTTFLVGQWEETSTISVSNELKAAIIEPTVNTPIGVTITPEKVFSGVGTNFTGVVELDYDGTVHRFRVDSFVINGDKEHLDQHPEELITEVVMQCILKERAEYLGKGESLS